MTAPVALTIAGSDSSGGAGIVADLKTFAALGVWGRVAITAVTAQDATGVHAIEPVSGGVVVRQIETALSDGAGAAAIKIGMLANLMTARSVADTLGRLRPRNVVLDPVLRSSTGASLLDGGPDAVLALLSSVAVVTPNLDEAAALLGVAPASSRDEMVSQATALSRLTQGAAMVTGGHLSSEESEGSADVLVSDAGDRVTWFEADRIPGGDLHGTGCVLSAAIAAELAKGLGLVAACRHAKAFVTAAIERGIAAGLGSVSP